MTFYLSNAIAYMSEIVPYLYRFRSARSVLEQFHELERQEIFFSAPEQLNDPMEGFRDIVWRGDAIAWKCHLKHYILCLMQTLSTFIIAGSDDYDVVGQHDFSFSTSDKLPTDALRYTYHRCCTLFFADDQVAQLPERLACVNHVIRRAELLFFLSIIHRRALASILEVFEEKGLAPATSQLSLSEISPLTNLSDEFFDGLNHLAARDETGEKLAEFFAGVSQIGPNRVTLRHDGSRIGWARIVMDFPEQYIDRLNAIMYPNWYVACFVKSPSHAAMWGNYADGHRGVCLKFRATPNTENFPSLRLKRITGESSSGPTTGYAPLRFRQVVYASRFPPVDFFTSIGTLPAASLRNQWYTSDDGAVSAVAERVLSEDKVWRSAYWDQYEASLITKLPDWEHEAEYRLVIGGGLINYSPIERRKLRYEFADLAGIIFGVRTDMTDKLAIIDLIRAKCRETSMTEFAFYQARYSPLTGLVEASTLPNML